MRANRSIAVAVSVALAVAGCATASKDIASTYISPNQYSTYDCAQLAAETARIQARVVQLGGRLDQAATNDAGIMAVGIILFWPVLFALGGTKQQEAEYARLKGEYEATEQAAIAKKCAHIVTPAPAVSQTAATSAPATSVITTPAPVPVPAVNVTSTAAPSPSSSQPASPAPTYASPTNAAAVSPSGAAPWTSKYMVNAERFAKVSGCTSAVSTMSVQTPTYETFTVTCANGDPRLIRCDDAVCRELK
jgi:hypothetical protein